MFFDTARKKVVAPRELTTLYRPAQAVEAIRLDELPSYVGDTMFLDCEVYPNYFLAAFKSKRDGKVICFASSPDDELDLTAFSWLLWATKLITFNGINYDMPIIAAALQCSHPAYVKQVSDFIIQGEETVSRVEKEFGFKCQPYNHIDLIEIAPLSASLKLYAGRMHAKRLQDLPFPPHSPLTLEQAYIVRDYCVTDLENTKLLADELSDQIALRVSLSEQYGQDLRSKSDAQLAEAIIVSSVQQMTGRYPGRAKIEIDKEFSYVVPEYVVYRTPELQAMLEQVRGAIFKIDANGYPRCPAMQELEVRLAGVVYAMGLGGLHSREKCRALVADSEHGVSDIDVASYYPRLILNADIRPSAMGDAFGLVYASIVERRLIAKKEKNKVEADSLKITANGTFGKLTSSFSAMYAPQGGIQVTLTGQLSILLLIEWLHLAGFEIASGNTDGVVVRYPLARKAELDSCVAAWAAHTGLQTEETQYSAMYNRDVNNYIAIKTDGEVKLKGVYAEKGSTGNTRLSKNPENLICSDAVVAFLTKGTPIAETVRASRDFTRFVSVRVVKGGGEHSGVYLGKVVRWYYAEGVLGTINYCLSGNKVPNTDDVKPCMDLPDSFPGDVDFARYIREAEAILVEIGHTKPQGQLF